ncbi:MAG TPA: hypothetical protein VMI32_05085 [Candidatus Solibacter sp.]|nr:hypothetical protein [Candidatus Solibacter sp.]
MKLYQASGGHPKGMAVALKSGAHNFLISYAHERDHPLIHFIAEHGETTRIEVRDEIGTAYLKWCAENKKATTVETFDEFLGSGQANNSVDSHLAL